MTSLPASDSAGRPAAFFDMDHTVLTIDSGMSWIRWLYRRREITRLYVARAVYWSLLYKAAVLDMESLAARLVADMKGDPEAELLEKATLWHRAELVNLIAPRALRAIERHRDRGDVLVMLTGSTQYAAECVSAGVGIEHTLCSRLEVVDGRFTGRLAERCFGVHKVTLAERFAAEHGVDLSRSAFYSDSYNDLPMLERVGTPVAVNPDQRLRRHARRAGWRIEQWA
jgi:HAD superfamily hydrolase (TIGR01490 family)